MKVALFGGTGFVGTYIAKELLKNENYEPRIGFEETKIITFKLSRKLKADKCLKGTITTS